MQLWLDALAWLQQSSLGNAIRASGVWTYALINLTHILGIVTLVGAVIVLDVALFGWFREVDLQSIIAVTVPLSMFGFVLAIVSGVCMLTTNGAEYSDNPFLPIKFAAIFLAVANAVLATRTSVWKRRGVSNDHSRRERLQLRVIASISLLCWLGAVSAGRMIGYW